MIRQTARRAFTLIELLVVIAIIGILAAMLLPVLNGVRSRSLRVTCSSNMRQVATAFISYSTDRKNRGFFPHEDRDSLSAGSTIAEGNYCWFDRIDDYLDTANLSRVKQCPAWEGYAALDNAGNTSDEHSMKMNSKLENGIDKNPLTGHSGLWPSDPAAKKYYFFPSHKARKLGETALLFDGQTITTASQTKGYIGSVDFNRHDGLTNFAYLDASAEGVDGKGAGITDPDGAGWTAEGPMIWDPFK